MPINNFKMSNKKPTMDDLETNIHSPLKTLNNFDKSAQQPWTLLNSQKPQQQFNSVTESHLYSRSIVRKLMQSTKEKTIRHEINQVDKSSVLYAKPSRYDRSQFNFGEIPPRNKNYASSCSSKIKHINERLNNKELPSQRSTKNHSQIRTSATETPKKSQQVSISGLVTYKFSSVNAQRSLGFNQINHESKMKDELRESSKIRDCPNKRFKKILYNTNHKKYKQFTRQEKSILSDFGKKTDEYLSNRVRENEEENLVYGEKAKNLHFIKDYMHAEKAPYEVGRHIVDQIEKYKPKQEYVKRRTCKTEVDEDLELEKRRVPPRGKRVKIRFLTFVD